MPRQKRVAAIHDISGFGKCSLTVALPILSAAGIETAVIPTAVLSTHTDGFEGYTYKDLTENMRAMAKHWEAIDLKFAAIYSGFLGSFEQIAIVKDFIDTFRRDECVVLVDPAMADNGKMYIVFDMNFAREMAGLCAKADIIIPNMTEAAFMLGQEYYAGICTSKYIEGLLHGLSALGPSKVVITGVMFDEDTLGAASYDKETDMVQYAFSNRISGNYHGTGDIFASTLLAAYLKGHSLANSAQIAVDFTCGSIQRTKDAGTDVRYGVDFETGISKLISEINT
ncbi:MAG: pyridoxamine kinase [Clostridiales bacterium]|nr:pyridoxamine kinase [Clostridiales bacterium]